MRGSGLDVRGSRCRLTRVDGLIARLSWVTAQVYGSIARLSYALARVDLDMARVHGHVACLGHALTRVT